MASNLPSSPAAKHQQNFGRRIVISDRVCTRKGLLHQRRNRRRLESQVEPTLTADQWLGEPRGFFDRLILADPADDADARKYNEREAYHQAASSESRNPASPQHAMQHAKIQCKSRSMPHQASPVEEAQRLPARQVKQLYCPAPTVRRAGLAASAAASSLQARPSHRNAAARMPRSENVLASSSRVPMGHRQYQRQHGRLWQVSRNE